MTALTATAPAETATWLSLVMSDLLVGLEAGRLSMARTARFAQSEDDGKAVGPALLVSELDGVAQVLDGMALAWSEVGSS